MRKIYFEKRCIIVCAPDDPGVTDSNAVLFRPGEGLGLDALTGMIENTPGLMRIYIPTPDEDETYRRICAEFKEVTAGGGVVSNRRGDYLLIRRNGLWDLPKGHLEAGEDIETCALREVKEETGVEALSVRRLVCITDHCYLRDGIWHLKHSWWYDMLYTEPVDLTPQLEEDITRAAWVPKSNIPACLTSTYPSIAEVFRNL